MDTKQRGAMTQDEAVQQRRDQKLARLDIVDWIEGWYNQGRLHTSIGYRTPAGFEQELFAA